MGALNLNSSFSNKNETTGDAQLKLASFSRAIVKHKYVAVKYDLKFS